MINDTLNIEVEKVCDLYDDMMRKMRNKKRQIEISERSDPRNSELWSALQKFRKLQERT